MPQSDAPSIQGEYDVAIMGGGLAGSALALQLKRDRPDTRVLVAERRDRPARIGAYKVGESSSEVGAHYYKEVLGLRDHIAEHHIRKTGLGFFFSADGNRDIARRVEFTTPRHPDVYTFQFDRGLLENELAERALAAGADYVRGARAVDFELGDERHSVTVERDGETHTVSARWLVGATGRAGFLKNRLGLARESTHRINAAWLRLDGGLDIEDWSDDEEWLGRLDRGVRKHRTNHFAGRGYWVWMIQLGTGPVSIGVCSDPRFHAFERFGDLDGMLGWLREHEPQIGQEIEGRREQVLDYLKVEDFAYNCDRVIARERWALTGEAGFFLDPLYSPGNDFIAMMNTVVTDTVRRDLAGEDVGERIDFFNAFLVGFSQSWLELYRDNYVLYGHPQSMLAKLYLDTCMYFADMCLRFYNGKVTDVPFMQETLSEVGRIAQVIPPVHALFRRWAELETSEPRDAFVIPNAPEGPLVWAQQAIPRSFEDGELRERLEQGARKLEMMAVVIFEKAVRSVLPDHALDEDTAINPVKMSLEPERWEEDGLFDPEGITPREAREGTAGLEQIWLDEQRTT